MRVLVDAMPLRRGGGVTYLRHQLQALARVAPDLRMHTLVSPWTEIDGLPGDVQTVGVRTVPTRFAYEQTRIGLRAADVLYAPANFGPSWARMPIVLTVHNANYYGRGLLLPEGASSRPPWKVRANHWAMKRADVVVAISDSLAEEVLSTVPAVRHKLQVIKTGAPEWPSEACPPLAGPEQPYFLSVASAAPHKRVDDVVAGWAQSRELCRDDVALALVGGHTDEQWAHYRRLAGRHADRLLALGAIRDRATLKAAYSGAQALVSMSLLEAFPLTPGEAGSVGCPLVLSDIPPHREVTSGNGTFVPPRDPGALAEVLASAASWTPGSKVWHWPITWDDNARSVAALFGQVSTVQAA